MFSVAVPGETCTNVHFCGLKTELKKERKRKAKDMPALRYGGGENFMVDKMRVQPEADTSGRI